MIESKENITEKLFFDSVEWKKTFRGKKIKLHSISTEFKHILSHQHIHAKFYEVSADLSLFKEPNPEWKKVNDRSINKYALPRLIEIYLENRIGYSGIDLKSGKKEP